MRILKDPDEYLHLQEWARKTVEELGYAGAEKLRNDIDKTIKRQGGLSGESLAFDIDKMEGMSDMLIIAHNETRLKSFMIERDKQEQRQKRGKRQKWGGLTREQISKRNQEIIEYFRKTHLTMSAFAQRYARKYKISPRSIRLILKKAIGNLPVNCHNS